MPGERYARGEAGVRGEVCDICKFLSMVQILCI